MSKNQALKVIGLHKSSWFYRTCPRPRTPDPTPAHKRSHPHRLDEEERHRITAALTNPEYGDKSIRQVFYHLLNLGLYLASLRTFYRIAADTTDTTDTTSNADASNTDATDAADAAGGVLSRRPVTLSATAPGQIICWDTTFLPQVFAGSRFAACVFVDLYSRRIIAWEVSLKESATGASRLCHQVIDQVAAAGGRVCAASG